MCEITAGMATYDAGLFTEFSASPLCGATQYRSTDLWCAGTATTAAAAATVMCLW